MDLGQERPKGWGEVTFYVLSWRSEGEGAELGAASTPRAYQSWGGLWAPACILSALNLVKRTGSLQEGEHQSQSAEGGAWAKSQREGILPCSDPVMGWGWDGRKSGINYAKEGPGNPLIGRYLTLATPGSCHHNPSDEDCLLPSFSHSYHLVTGRVRTLTQGRPPCRPPTCSRPQATSASWDQTFLFQYGAAL
jgi:hypothetical protein